MFIKRDSHAPYFSGVALATIICGAAIIAIGLVQSAVNIWGYGTFFMPSLKIVGGLVVTSLGYIHLELELIRIK